MTSSLRPCTRWAIEVTADASHRPRSPKMAELIARDIRRRIILGELGAGDTLPSELALIARYEVSRNVLREALRILESESMIELRRGARGGAQVRTPDVRVAARYFGLLLQWRDTTLGDVFRARLILESAAVRELVLARHDTDLVGALSERADAAEERVADFTCFSDTARAFSNTLIQLTGNNTLALQHEMVEDMIAAHVAKIEARLQLDPVAGEAANTRAVRAMRRLIRLIERGDARAAEDYWREHLSAVTPTIAEGLDQAAVVDLVDHER
jgi:GntR family transcriptional regulator, transcriptional repressor for pyruvate dehydrogenase complex